MCVYMCVGFWLTTHTQHTHSRSLSLLLLSISRVSTSSLSLSHNDGADPPSPSILFITAVCTSLWILIPHRRCWLKVLSPSLSLSHDGWSPLTATPPSPAILPHYRFQRVELHQFWRQDELVKFCQSKGIRVSAHTPLGVPTSNPRPSDSGSVG